MTTATMKALLERNFLFHDVSGVIVDKVAELAMKHSYPKGAMIFCQGDPGNVLYGVLSGQVRISINAADGQEVFFNIMEAGDTFGEIALLDGRPRTANATAIAATELFLVHRNQFMDLLEREPKLSIHLLQLLCDRVRWTNELLEETVFLDVPARLAKRLLSLSKLHGRVSERGAELSLSQKELAQFLSISRQIVNHHLQEWRDKGWVELSRGKIIICDADALRASTQLDSS